MILEAFTLFAKLTLDTKEYDSKLGNVTSGLGAGLGAAAKIGAAAIGATTAAVGAFAKSSIDAGSRFDSSMAQVAATMGKTVDEIQDLRVFAQEMGATTAFSASQAADALNYMALAGYDSQTSMKMLPNVLNLAASGGMDLATASDMVTDASSALGLSLDETSLMIDKMAKTASTTNTSVAQLGSAILTVGGTAKILSGGTTELSQALGLLADNGVKGAAGGTALRNILLNLTPKSEDAAKAMKQLGFSAYDEMGKLRPLKDIFLDLNKAMEDMTDEQKTGLIGTIFNKADLKSVNALLATTSERWDQVQNAINAAWFTAGSADEQLGKLGLSLEKIGSNLTFAGISQEQFNRALGQSGGDAHSLAEILYEMSDSSASYDDIVRALGGDLNALQKAFNDTTGAAQAMADTQLDNLAGDITIMKSALEGVQIAFSDKVNPYLRQFVQEGTKGLESLKEAFDTGNFNNVIYVLTESFTDLVNTFLESAPQFLEVGTMVLGSLMQGIINNAPQLLTTAGVMLQSLANGIIQGLPLVTEAAVNILNGLTQGVTQNMPQLISTAMQMLMDFSGSLRENVGLIVDAGLELIMALAESLIDNLPVFIQTVPTIVSNIAGIINDNAPKLLASGITLIGKLAAGVIQSIPVIVQEFPKILKMIADVITAFNWIQLGTHIITFIKNGVTSLVNELPNALKDIGNKGIEAVKGIDWKNLGTNIINFIKDGIQSLVTSIPDALKAIGENAMEVFKNIDWLSLGSNIISGIVSGITNGAREVMDAIGGLASDVLNAGKKALGIASPSKKFRYYGKMVDEGFALGIADNMSVVDKAMNSLTDVSAPSFDLSASENGVGYQGNIEVNVYGAQGQDVRELADIVVDEIDRRIRSRQEVYA